MNDNAATTDDCGRFSVVCCVHLVVVDDVASDLVPDLNPKLVIPPSTVYLAVNGCQYETILSLTIDRPRTLELRPGTGNY